MLQSTFQIAPGIGPAKEHSLWARGIACWDDLPAAPSVALSKQRDPALRAAVDDARAALARGDADALAAMLPSGEHWRMFADFGDGAAYLDIETGDEVVGFAGISAIGCFDRNGPRIFLAGRDLDEFPSSRARLVDAGHLQRAIVRRADPAPRVSRVDAAARARRSAPRPVARGP